MHSIEARPIRLVFYGTSDFAIPSLERLVNASSFEVVGVVTQPDRAAGRHGTVQAPPIKEAALRLRLPVYQFEQIKSEEALRVLKTLTADMAVVASFGQIMSQTVLDLYPLGAINVHPSLLPKYRGPTPFVDPILNGDKETGVSFIKMDALMDHGPLLKQIVEPIQSDDTGKSLGDRLWQRAADHLTETLMEYAQGNIILKEQDHSSASKTHLLSREAAKIDWTQDAERIERKIRAFIPWPGTYTIEHGKRFKIQRAKIGPDCLFSPGRTFIHEGVPAICCGNKTSLLLLDVQPEGKKWMEGKFFLHGCRTWEQTTFDIK